MMSLHTPTTATTPSEATTSTASTANTQAATFFAQLQEQERNAIEPASDADGNAAPNNAADAGQQNVGGTRRVVSKRQ